MGYAGKGYGARKTIRRKDNIENGPAASWKSALRSAVERTLLLHIKAYMIAITY